MCQSLERTKEIGIKEAIQKFVLKNVQSLGESVASDNLVSKNRCSQEFERLKTENRHKKKSRRLKKSRSICPRTQYLLCLDLPKVKGQSIAF